MLEFSAELGNFRISLDKLRLLAAPPKIAKLILIHFQIIFQAIYWLKFCLYCLTKAIIINYRATGDVALA